jgi:hypothetical protein
MEGLGMAHSGYEITETPEGELLRGIKVDQPRDSINNLTQARARLRNYGHREYLNLK